jgi:hypothetical protein
MGIIALVLFIAFAIGKRVLAENIESEFAGEALMWFGGIIEAALGLLAFWQLIVQFH